LEIIIDVVLKVFKPLQIDDILYKQFQYPTFTPNLCCGVQIGDKL